MWLSEITARPKAREQWVKRAPVGIRRWHLARDYARFVVRERRQAEALLSRIRDRLEGGARREAPPAMFRGAAVRVAVFGAWDGRWMHALGSDSDLWRGLAPVQEVRSFDGRPNELENYAAAAESPLLVLPLVEKHALAVPDALRVRIPYREVIQLLANKARSSAYMAARWADCLPGDYANLDEVVYPCVIKPVRACGSAGIAIIESREALLDALETCWLQREAAIIQTFVPGDREQVTHAMCADGQILWECSFDKPRCLYRPTLTSVDSSEMRLISTHPRIRALLRELAAELGYSGPLCVDYRVCEEGPKIFEINPRFGGSLMEPWSRSLLRECVITLVDSMPSPAACA